MKQLILITLFITSIISAQPKFEIIQKEAIPNLLKTNSSHQNKLLTTMELVKNYDNYLSSINEENIEKAKGDEVPFEVFEKSVNYGGEVKIISTLDMNLSYLLDLTQNVFTIAELSDIIKDEKISQNKYLSILGDHIKSLNEELDNKYNWLIKVDEYYTELDNEKAIEIVKDSKELLKNMKEYYSSVVIKILQD